jgi:hypothetical protein
VSALTGVGRTSYLVITAGRLVYKVLVVQGMQWAYSNIILKDGKLTFATTAAENAQIPANSQGLNFKWGSLIGLNTVGAQSSAFTSSRISFVPSEYTGTVPITDYSTIPSPAALSLDSYDPSAGTGDICRYISDKGWVEGRWRMPTLTEAQQTIACGTIPYGSFGVDYTWTETDGTHLTDSGIFFATTTDDESYLTGDMPIGAMFLPSGGAIVGNGVVSNMNTLARFWTSTGYDDRRAYCLYGNTGSVYVTALGSSSDSYKNEGRNVRCIRDV